MIIVDGQIILERRVLNCLDDSRDEVVVEALVLKLMRSLLSFGSSPRVADLTVALLVIRAQCSQLARDTYDQAFNVLSTCSSWITDSGASKHMIGLQKLKSDLLEDIAELWH